MRQIWKLQRTQQEVNNMRILIIEDEKRLAATVADLLRKAGYTADTEGNGLTGLERAKRGDYDALILDVMLPGMDGYTVLRRLREAGKQTPVLMLTARSGLEDRICGLDAGADYYLSKPFENEELLACLRTILRRVKPDKANEMSFGDLHLMIAVSSLNCGEKSLPLSARELDMMRLLMSNTSQYLSKEMLLSKVWGYDADVGESSVEAYVSFLRKKLHLLGSETKIAVARGIGYRLEVEQA